MQLSPHLSAPKTGLLLLGFIFLICGLYFQPNIGGEGLFLPYNAAIWTGTALTISLGIFLALRNRIFIYSHYWPGLLAFPLCVIISGYIADTLTPVEWLFRQLYIIAGVAFLFTLFQFHWKNKDLDKLLYLLLIAGFIQAVYGTVQLIWQGNIVSFMAPNISHQGYGIFQQINLQASFQATMLLICLYALTRPGFKNLNIAGQIVLFLCLFSSTYMIAIAGSRVGILSATIGIVIIFCGRFAQIKKRQKTFIIALIVIITSSYLGKAGITRSYNKLSDLTGEVVAVQGSSNRKNIYATTYEVVKESPWVGHGIGSFQGVWQHAKIEFLNENPDAIFPADRLSHPHNEILFWAAEGGLVALTGVFIAMATILIAAFRCGWRRGISYLALLFPLGLHAMVELPFYISSLHWILFLTLFFLILQHSRKAESIRISQAATLSLKVVSLLIVISTAGFMYQANKANTAIVNFLNTRMSQPALLQPALENTYFNETAELYLMRTLMLRSLKSQNYDFLPEFITWAESFLQKRPVPQLFIDLSQAYKIMGNKAKSETTMAHVRAMYPNNAAIKNADKFLAQLAASQSVSAPRATGEH
ncbi:PglL family O-oligosaccharyltransferase [Aliamphritea spongicola]|uniref:PglL family O-oligosaccharyltransferase n=1 Tax=Aliamphritea spongicola TaxID=707589 RepID=UPI00196B9CE3|nr:Wzy polymerase domain-containing protein [Aliamphritea spongicola]MBN3560572.1 O-antigen ligase C-terminal domain-containing protein [Aliamphritea spongicola]